MIDVTNPNSRQIGHLPDLDSFQQCLHKARLDIIDQARREEDDKFSKLSDCLTALLEMRGALQDFFYKAVERHEFACKQLSTWSLEGEVQHLAKAIDPNLASAAIARARKENRTSFCLAEILPDGVALLLGDQAKEVVGSMILIQAIHRAWMEVGEILEGHIFRCRPERREALSNRIKGWNSAHSTIQADFDKLLANTRFPKKAKIYNHEWDERGVDGRMSRTGIYALAEEIPSHISGSNSRCTKIKVDASSFLRHLQSRDFLELNADKIRNAWIKEQECLSPQRNLAEIHNDAVHYHYHSNYLNVAWEALCASFLPRELRRNIFDGFVHALNTRGISTEQPYYVSNLMTDHLVSPDAFFDHLGYLRIKFGPNSSAN